MNVPVDTLAKQNDKIGVLFEQAVSREKMRIGNGFYAGLMPSSALQIDRYLRWIKTIESYASHGTASTDKFNKLQVKITFNNGTVVDKLYTGIRVVQSYDMSAQLLVKMELLNGKVVKTYTNGVEINSSPTSIEPDIEYIKEAVLNYDRTISWSAYYYPAKTQENIKEEWSKIK